MERRRDAYRGEACDFVSQSLGLDDGHFLGDPLVGVKIQSETVVVLLDDDPRGLLHSLGADATCVRGKGGLWCEMRRDGHSGCGLISKKESMYLSGNS
jgi:hypothetical protein